MLAELIDGVLHLQPRPARRHVLASSRIGARILTAFDSDSEGDGSGGWVILDEPELHLSGDIVVPDLAGWRTERYDASDDDGAYHTVAPDWCCEVLSPSTQGHDRIVKSSIYAREGVGTFWVVHPTERWIEAFERMPSGQWALIGVFAGQGEARIRPFHELALPLDRLWGPKVR